MARYLLYLVAAALIGVCAAVHEDCEIAPPADFASTQIEDQGDTIRAIYSCQVGYILEGPRELVCDLDTDEWNTDPPNCVKETISNEVHEESQTSKRKQQQQNIPEDRMVSPALASTLDMSCVQAKVKAPEIRYGSIQKYDRRRKGDKVFLVALYACVDNFEFEDSEINTLYCSERKWVGDLPVCVSLGEYEEEEYEEYEVTDEEDNEDVAEGEYDEQEQIQTTATPPPPPPSTTTAEPSTTTEYSEDISNEISPVESERPNESGYSYEDTNRVEEQQARERVTEANNTSAEPTPDPYSPRVVDENCGEDNGGCDQKCQRVLFPDENQPRIQCFCAEGFSLDPYDYSTCHDINECELPEIAEECPTGCENTHGSYRCITNSEEINANEEVQTKVISPPETLQCGAGYRIQENQCVDVDECSEGTSGCEMCINTVGSYECTCPPGYDLAEDEKTCVDIDECVTVAEEDDSEAAYRVCSHDCQNTVGSFHCSCPPLYHLTEDRRTCAIDSCADLENPALNKTRCYYNCEDQPGGSFRCTCPDGYSLVDEYNCVEKQDACQLYNGAELCAPGTCHPDESEAGFTCRCPVGYRELNNRCVDVDECSEGAHKCSHKCINTEGGFRCECPEGFFLPESQRYECEDVDECVVEPGICGMLKCVNFPGAFNCLCENDSEPNEEGICASMVTDPCRDHSCSHDCIPEGESYRCGCPAHLSLDHSQRECVEHDLCAVNKNGCDHICNNGDNGSCSCYNGFTLDANGKSCLDIDECLVNNGGCHQLCTNIAGSFECLCEPGFELAEDQATCLDIDECGVGKHACSHGCVNVDGSFHCTCPEGYYLGENRTQCLDKNECNDGNHGCTHNCYNTVGSYLCACPEGFRLAEDEKTCINTLCYENNGGCSHSCDPESGCSCPPGYVLGANGKTCEDFNECLADNGGCSFKCLNLLGAHECVCPDGSKPANPGDACPITCPAGFTFGRDDPDKCEDIDECSLPGVCQFQCLNTNGSYECLCPKGYRLQNGRECVDIDECAENNGGCVGGECFNHNGGFECKCPLGQRLAFDRKTCEALPEMRDQCLPLDAPSDGAVHCTKYRHKKKRFYNTRCKVWCNQGFQLEGPSHRYCNASGQWDHHENRCLPTTCPRLPLPQNAVISPVSCTFGKINVGEQCRLKCNVGFMPAGKSVAVCTSQMLWSYNGTFDCVPMQIETRLGASNGFTPMTLPTRPPFTLPSIPSTTYNAPPNFNFKPSTYGGVQRPYIKCPRNTTVYLASGERTAHIILQKPITNMDYHYIESSPAWTRDLQAHLGAGSYVVVFRGHDPISGQRARCKTVINVKHADGPAIEFCTPSFEVTLNKNQAFRSVVWEEPRFDSTLSPLRKVYKSRLPGELFGLGIHIVNYEATNEDGLTAKCEFKIHVKPYSASAQPSLPSGALGNFNAGTSTTSQHYHIGMRPRPVVPSPPISKPATMSAPLLPGHESFIICPGRDPVKVTHSQSVELPPNCILKNVRINPFRQFMSQRAMPRLWTFRHY